MRYDGTVQDFPASKKDVPQNVNFAIKTAVAMSFLEANGVVFDTM